jgi:hypothetical protein
LEEVLLMMYAKVEHGSVVRAAKRPDWRGDDGMPLTDAELAARGWLPVQDERPEHNADTHRLVRNTATQWIAGDDFVTMTWTVQPLARDQIVSRIMDERARRLSLGFDYDFGDERGVHRVGTTEADLRGWDEVSTASQALIAIGAPGATLNIVTDTGPVAVTALEWQQVLVAAAQHRQPIWAASFAIQAMDPIPVNFRDDELWQ